MTQIKAGASETADKSSLFQGGKHRNTIARKVTRRVFLMLIAALIILSGGAYHSVSSLVSEENDEFAVAVLNMYSDLLLESSMEKQLPIDAEHPEDAIRLGNYICNRCNADFAYVYVLDEEKNTVTYIAASFSESTADKNPGDHLVGRTVEYKPLKEELAVWNGEKSIARMAMNNSYGYEITTIRLIEDCKGNKLIIGVDVSHDAIKRLIIKEFLILAVIVIAVFIGVGWAMYLTLIKQVSAPAQRLSQSMQKYITNGIRSDVKLQTGGPEEYAMIASAFNSMTENIDFYIDNIKELTREQTNRRTELDIAAGIQRGFLPDAMKEWNECEIRSAMIPAKDVGGDLYDYLRLDDGRFLTVIADVSGKGISASMLMSVILMLIRQFARMGFEPDEILERTNDTLSENNPKLLFATAFVGIYDSRTRSYTYSNAGHNMPYIAGRRINVLDGAKGMLLGIYKGEKYSSETVQLQPGDMVFLYTDGISEAYNPTKGFFGEERITKVLQEFRASHEENPVAFMQSAVEEFSEEAEQHDDITMLTLTVKDSVFIETGCDIREFEKIKTEILKLPLHRSRQLQLCLAAEEIFINICSYAFKGLPHADEKIGFSMKTANRIELCFTDSGFPYNPLEEITDPESYDADTQIGGLGKLIAVSAVDDTKYEYRDGKNILTLIMYYREEI